MYPVRIVITLSICISAAACKSTDTANETAATSEKSELEELYWARVDSSRMSFTEADVNFMRGMIAHHAQALIMSRLAPENGANQEVQILAARIINAQQDEIETMQMWLRDRNQPVPKIEIEGLNLMVEIDGEPYTKYKMMHGVLSQKQLENLAAARGAAFDQIFLKYMIEHHSGAVHMVDNLFSADGAAQDNEAYRLASNIQVDQKTEIERMNMMLDELTGSG